MTIKEQIQNRQTLNREIVKTLRDYNILNNDKLLDKIEKMVEQCPKQRFGQIIVNYFCQDYRDQNVSDKTKDLFDRLMFDRYPKNVDVFFIESYELYNNLIQAYD
jgi:hypothetical protein